MALEGSFSDFGLADIFQMIGLQKKTGVLTVRGEAGKLVTTSFERGTVVFADEFQRTEAERLGNILQRTRRISPEVLAKAVEIQKSTSQRLGHILVENKIISAQELRQALQLQVKESVYRLFRWKEGSYHFSAEPVTYDRELYQPIPAEFVLMEGTRMIDEWPILEKKIPNFDLVFQRAAPPAPAAAKSAGLKGDIEDLMALVEEEGEGAPAVSGAFEHGGEALGPKESAILKLVDGRRTVQELIDIGQLGEFETCKILYGLLSLNLIRQVVAPMAPAAPTPAPLRADRSWSEFGVVGIAAAVLLVVFLFNPWGIVAQGFRSRQGLKEAAALGDEIRLRRIRLALEVFHLEKQSYPPDLEKLVESGLLRSRDLRGRAGAFAYRGGAKEFQLGAE